MKFPVLFHSLIRERVFFVVFAPGFVALQHLVADFFAGGGVHPGGVAEGVLRVRVEFPVAQEVVDRRGERREALRVHKPEEDLHLGVRGIPTRLGATARPTLAEAVLGVCGVAQIRVYRFFRGFFMFAAILSV